MKQKIVFLFFVLLLSSFLASARDLFVPPKGPKQGEKEVKVNRSNLAQSDAADLKDDMDELIGSEKCNEKDEECSTRRMIADAHLDYIYTEHHKP